MNSCEQMARKLIVPHRVARMFRPPTDAGTKCGLNSFQCLPYNNWALIHLELASFNELIPWHLGFLEDASALLSLRCWDGPSATSELKPATCSSSPGHCSCPVRGVLSVSDPLPFRHCTSPPGTALCWDSVQSFLLTYHCDHWDRSVIFN